ncbi:MAG: hypothetical protein ACWGNP_02950 [Candidatus Bathyarchaeia archaeon]
MEPKNPNKPHKKTSKGKMNTLTQHRPEHAPTNNCNTITNVYSRLSSLVSSETVYSLPFSPKTRYK